jgi:hypothetical protein
MAKNPRRVQSILRTSALLLTSSQLQALVTQEELEGALGDASAFRAKILNLFAYAESETAWREKKARLYQALETSLRRDPVIEEFHLTKRVQKYCREQLSSEEPAPPLIQAQVREMVALGTVREIRKFPRVSPPRAYFCHKDWWPAYDTLTSSVTENLAARGTLSSLELDTLADEAFGAGQNVTEAIHAVREWLMYQGLMDSPGRVLLRPGETK